MPLQLTRRRAALSFGAATLATPALTQNTPVTVRIGWNPLAGGSGALCMLMIRDKLFEAEALKIGRTVTLDWKSFLAGPPATEAMVAGQLDIDLHSAGLPAVGRVAGGVPATPFGVVGSHISNAVMVPPNSPIKRVIDLEGKRVGLPIGTSAHYLLASIVKIHTDKSLQQAGVKLINMPAADALKMPNGIDAAAVWVPLRFMGPQLGICQLLIDGDGFTGKGAAEPGIRTKEVERSWAFPEGYNTDRLYAYASDAFLAKQPELLTAFLLAHMEAQRRAVANPEALVTLASERWQQDKLIARTTLQTYAETAGIRRAPFMLEWDALTIVKASEFLHSIGARDTALTMADLKPILTKTAPQQQTAWAAAPDKVTEPNLLAGFSGKTELYGPITVNGGAPVWAWIDNNWGQRLYKPGPF